MSGGGKLHSKEWQVERDNQPYADIFYKKMGWKVKRNGTLTHDLKINNKRVEEKFRLGIFPDILIEILQDMRSIVLERKNALGWFYTEQMEHLFYFMGCEAEKGPEKLYTFNWHKFKRWLWTRLEDKTFHKFQTSTEGYGLTLNLLIATKDIPSELYTTHRLR